MNDHSRTRRGGRVRRASGRVRIMFLMAAACAVVQPASAETSGRRVAIVIDERLYDAIRPGLERYFAAVRESVSVEFDVLAGAYAGASPEVIRNRLAGAYADSLAGDGPRLGGAILVGTLPYAKRGGGGIIYPAPLYYEDFDAEWVDADGDGVFDEIRTDRAANPTEIWTAWWMPPSQDLDRQADEVNGFLDKLERFHRGGITGTDGALFIASPINSTEITESWAVLMRGVLGSAGHALEIWSRTLEEPDVHHPDPGPEFLKEDLVRLFTDGRRHHAHIITHGSPGGFFWNGQSLTTQNLDFAAFDDTGANLVTTSGCSNGNFRGRMGREADYARSMGNRLLFATNTVTVAYFGSASPQSTGVFAMYANELLEALMPERESFLAEGYFAMRNADHAWGIERHFFRGMDEKILCGDPFFRYRQR